MRRVLFVGTHERQLDDKGRLALPAAFRALLGEHCYLAKGPDKCIEVIPAETFERDAMEAMDAVRRGDATRNTRRSLAGTASLVTMDKQGRVKLDDALRTYAEIPLEHQVLVTGNFDRLEIWEPERRRRIETAGDDELAGGDE
ncbi:MAG: mraZ [Ilumatobacteraceae bacterium]|nr:mraZ [Ilumatobacteraceae bacterium]